MGVTACTADPDTKPEEPRLISSTPGTKPAAEWAVGEAGGKLSSADGTIEINVPQGAAEDGTVVRLTQSAGSPVSHTHLATLSSFDITPTKGRLDSADVTVRVDPAVAARATDAGVMMLIEDHRGGWQVLDTTFDRTASTITGHWTHFSRGWVSILPLPFGGKNPATLPQDFATWLRDHVFSYGLGPKKEPDCDKVNDKSKRWRTDDGWKFESGNRTGGKMSVPPLAGCAAVADRQGKHPIEVTNRYWYGFSAGLPDGASLTVDDILAHTELTDAIIGGLEALLADRILIPGHSRARFSLAGEQRGQTVRLQATADPVSLVLAAVITAVDVATLGSARQARLAVEALEDSLWNERAKRGGKLTSADIAGLMADESWVAANVAKHRPKGIEVAVFERFFDHLSLYNCAYDAFQAGWGSDVLSGHDKQIEKIITDIGSILVEVVNDCKAELAVAVVGKMVKSPGERDRIAEHALRALFDFKSIQAVQEAQWAGWASLVGLDYFHARLTITQARDPRIDLFAGFDWAAWLRPRSNCTEQTGEAWNVYSARLLSRRDLTGDGYPEYLLIGQCPSHTSAWPEVVYVVDGFSEPAEPKLIGTFNDDYWRGVKVSTTGSGRKIVLILSRKALSDDAAFCCPDLMVTLKYRWNKDKFTRISRKVTRLPN